MIHDNEHAPFQHSRPVALITGAARRLGAALARHLHARGHDLLIHCHHSRAEAEALREELDAQRAGSASVLEANLGDPAQVRRLADRALEAFGRLDVLINNASQFFPTPLDSAKDRHWDLLFGTNVRAPFLLIQQLAAALRASRGCVVNITDIYAERPLPGHSLYSASKAALMALTQSLARELAPSVRVNAIAPGAILWPSGQDEEAADPADAAYRQSVLDKVALGRCGTPEDIAKAAWFLIAEAPYVTGQVIRIDGGRSLHI